jgi:hypothetical protein
MSRGYKECACEKVLKATYECALLQGVGQEAGMKGKHGMAVNVVVNLHGSRAWQHRGLRSTSASEKIV